VLLHVDPQADGGTLRHIFEDSGAGILFTDADLMEKFAKLLAGKTAVRLLGRGAGKEEQPVQAVQERNAVAVDAGDTAALFHTSGTTGPPKGVPLSHANLVGQPAAVAKTGFLVKGDRVLLPLPLHHVYPFVIGLLTPLALGVAVISPPALTGPEIVRAIAEGRASILIGVPRLYRTLYEGIRSRVRGRGRASAALFHALLACSALLNRHGMRLGRYFFPFVHHRFGGSLRILASGGAALDPLLADRH